MQTIVLLEVVFAAHGLARIRQRVLAPVWPIGNARFWLVALLATGWPALAGRPNPSGAWKRMRP
jgi:hypothetical protein